ncbi:catecholate siderophore receptor CirA [Tistrella bauzanensis]|uniref:Catecholate siderophore receptor CirA n=1 Tax=Tistrella bauzanensis TaxID=657419 RepID=A0ABQ1J7F0_9PROT|nr:TonB-dependent receptor [Tistrella bauzanensis]GGB59314.1 catecholate siderophore receptor CirA [Tistrella bauzanensis]
MTERRRAQWRFRTSMADGAKAGMARAGVVLAGTMMSVAAEAQERKPDELDQMVVSATRTEEAGRTAPASVTVVDGAQLKSYPVSDLTEAIRDVPGISLTAGSQGRRQISIRGMDPSFTLILVDGKRVNSTEAVFRHNDFDIGSIPVAAIERIEVVRGGMSALYGSEAMGGVINIITKPASKIWSGRVDLGVDMPTEGDRGTEARTSFYLSGPVVAEKLAITVTGTFDRREVWNGQSGGPVIADNGNPVRRPDGSVVDRADLATLEGREDYQGRVKFTLTPDDDQTIEAEFGRSRQTRFGEYYISGWGDADGVVVREDAALSHEGRWGWGTTQLRAYTEVSTTGDDGIRQENRVVEGNAALPFDRHTLVVGGEARWIELKSGGEFTSGGAETDAQALYVQDEFRLTDTVKLLAGARLDEDRYFGTHVTPRGYAVWTPTPAVTIKGGVSTGFKAPTLRQLSPDSRVLSCRGGCVILGNPDLKPEESVNYELSAGYDTGDWGATVTIFRNDIENLIDTPRGSGVPPVGTESGTGLPIYGPVNINEARIEGIEVSGYAMLWDWGRASANWTWLDARNEMTGAVLDNRPKHVLNGKVDWFVSDEVMAYSRATYTGRQRSGSLTLDPYTLVDVGADWQISDAISVRGGVLNLADTSTGDPDDDYAYVERGRTVFVGASARF